MSDPNEQPDVTQQETGSAQDGTEGTVEATPAAVRKAQELGVDLTSVEGTGAGGRVTAADVDNAQQQPDSATRSIMAASGGPGVVEPTTPRDAILEQYLVLKATLVGPIEGLKAAPDGRTDGRKVNRIDLSKEQITLDNGSNKTILEVDPAGTLTKINFPTDPPDFFAPFPPIVEWNLPDPQPPIPVTLEGTKQPCRSERCSINE